MHTRFWLGNLLERGHMKNPGVEERMVLKMDLQEVGWGGMDKITLVQGGARWWAHPNAVMDFRVALNEANFLTTRARISFSARTLLHGFSYLCSV